MQASHRMENLGPGVQAPINDDWRERYINYRELLKLLEGVERNSIKSGGEGGSGRSRPSSRNSSRRLPPSHSYSSSSSSCGTTLSRRIKSTIEKIRSCFLGPSPPQLAMPTTSKIGRRLQELVRSSSSAPPPMELEVSLYELDVWLQRHDHPALSRSSSVRDTGIQVRARVRVRTTWTHCTDAVEFH